MKINLYSILLLLIIQLSVLSIHSIKLSNIKSANQDGKVLLTSIQIDSSIKKNSKAPNENDSKNHNHKGKPKIKKKMHDLD